MIIKSQLLRGLFGIEKETLGDRGSGFFVLGSWIMKKSIIILLGIIGILILNSCQSGWGNWKNFIWNTRKSDVVYDSSQGRYKLLL